MKSISSISYGQGERIHWFPVLLLMKHSLVRNSSLKLNINYGMYTRSQYIRQATIPKVQYYNSSGGMHTKAERDVQYQKAAKAFG